MSGTKFVLALLIAAGVVFGAALLGLNIVLLVLVFVILDRGRIVSPAYSRLDRRDLEKLRQAAHDRTRFHPAEAGD